MNGPLELFRMDGKVAVVTGAAGLLGRQHCEALAAAGAHVVLADLDCAEAGRCAGELAERFEGRSLGAELDVTQKDSVEELAAIVDRTFGRVDVLVNNAAINDKVESARPGSGWPFEQLPLESWRATLDVNATGTFLCCQVFGHRMARRGSGSIVNIASTYALVGPDQSLYADADGTQTFFKSAAYCASKGAISSLSRFLAAYWGRLGVRVNTLTPGGVENGQDQRFVERYAARTPLGRMARPMDYRGALLFLASEASGYMTGSDLVVDGGWTTW